MKQHNRRLDLVLVLALVAFLILPRIASSKASSVSAGLKGFSVRPKTVPVFCKYSLMAAHGWLLSLY